MKKLLLPLLLPLGFAAFGQAPDASHSSLATDKDSNPYSREMEYRHIKEKSFYVMMDDSIEIAVSVFLPKGMKKNQKLSTILYQTRYWRAVGLRWPFKWFGKMIPSTANFNPLDFVRYGYALVSVDVRGTGASYGLKTLTLPDIREVMDSKQIIEWITQQSWSNGKVGATGVSYIGNTALYQLIDPHPALKAIVPAFSVFDLYDDVSAPGGIYFHQFIQSYGEFCAILDKNILPPSRKNLASSMASYGVERVQGYPRKKMKEAVAQHRCNLYQMSEGATAEYMDDTTTINGYLDVVDILSPHQFKDIIKASKIPIYSWSGWWDAGFQHSAIRQFFNLDNGQNLLRIGPWNHGSGANVSPNLANKSQYDNIKEIVRFFDYHLRDMKNGLYSAPRVNYYTMGENVWRSSSTWPPENATSTTLYFNTNATATFNPKETKIGSVVYEVDTTHTIGEFNCRWDFNTSHYGATYSDRTSQDSITLTFTSPELTAGLEVTGHPQLYLYLKNSTPDGAVFVFLEDVDENGNAWNVTDGQIRLIHRKILDEDVNYVDCVPVHGYRTTDAEPMDTSKVELVSLDLLPTSHLFKKGHRIRIRLAGADATNFKNMYHEQATWQVQFGEVFPSRIWLPGVERDGENGLEIQGKNRE